MLLYIDSGTGSMLVQVVIAGFLAVIMFFKQLKHKIMILFKKNDDSEINEHE